MYVTKEYLSKEENVKELQAFCDKHGITKETILQSTKCYNKNMMVIQAKTSSGDSGLNDNIASKIVLTIRKTADGLLFEPAEDMKKNLV